jgi:hypothetical protein
MDSRTVRQAAALAVALLLPGTAQAFTLPTVSIVSPPPGLPAANGASDNPAFSQDDRDVRLLAYDSAAGNLVPGDTNGHRDVFVLARAFGDSDLRGRLSRVSVSSRGRQANGDSSHPAVDGTTGARPHCIAFESTATNLDRADRTPGSDIYLRDLRSRTTTLVSVGRGIATSASIDGRCRFVVYRAGGVIFDRDLQRKRSLRIGRGNRPDQQTDGKGVAYQHAGQVWYQRLAIGHAGISLSGAPRLVSNTPTGAPASGVSDNPSVDDHGRHVAFDSTATDICNLSRCGWEYHPPPNSRKFDPGSTPEGVDANGPSSDVFLAIIGAPPQQPASMALVSYDFSYNQLDGSSVDPQVSRAGRGVVFSSGPATAWGNSPESITGNVYYWSDASQHFVDGHLHLVSYKYRCVTCRVGTAFNGPSLHPSMSSRGNFIAFTSSETGVAGESNGAAVPDVFLEFFAGAPAAG